MRQPGYYPEPFTFNYNGYNINMLTGEDGYYPQIWLNGKWIHEFGGFWKDKELALEVSKKFIDQCNGVPTTNAQLFAMFRK